MKWLHNKDRHYVVVDVVFVVVAIGKSTVVASAALETRESRR